MNNFLPFDRVAPDVVMMKQELIDKEELRLVSLRQDMVLAKMGDIMKKHYPSEPELLIDFTCPATFIGVYIIGHKDGSIADIGQGRIMNRVSLKRQFLVENPCKLDATKDYRVAKKIAEYDPDPTQWFVQYVQFYGITAKIEAREWEEVIHQRCIENGNEPMFASLHMCGVG